MTPPDTPGAKPPADEGPGGPEETGPAPGVDDAGASPGPTPATYAGRRALERELGAPAEPGSEQPSRLTEEFEEAQRELEDEPSLDEAVAGEELTEEDWKPAEKPPADEDLAPGQAPPAEEDWSPAAEPPEPAEEPPEPADEEQEPAEEEPAGEPPEPPQPSAEAPKADDATESADEAPEPAAEAPEPEGESAEAEATALGDREEAREAALAGLRARAAEQATKRHTAVRPPAPAPPPAPAAPPPAAPAPTAATAPPQEAGEAPPQRGLWSRFLAGSLVIIVSMATATAVSILLYLTEIARGLGGIEGVQSQLAQVEGGDPQTILILGSDKRPTEDTGRSDTTILLRIDPDRDVIALLSLPRDLKVNIPGRGVDKLNAAYSYGGPKLTLKVVKQLTKLEVNHVVNINFTGFADAVNAIDCVYVDVDRHYFVPPEASYAEIDVDAGYQRLCGLKALQYVRFRHDDNDLVRAARQQDFLREARQKVPPSKLISDRNELIDIFTDYTTSDIRKGVVVLEVLKTFLGARGAEVKQIHFKGDLGGPGSVYVTASADQIQTAVKEFLGIEPPPRPQGETSGGDGGRKGDRDEDGKPAKPPPPPPLMDSSAIALERARALMNRELKIPVMYPTRLVPGSTFNDASRSFRIDGPGKDVYHGYKMVVGLTQPNAAFTQYYGLSGTDWEDPPILENPSETREIEGREYMLFYDGDRLRLVGWKTKRGSYWVINTLLQTLSEEQMVAVARSVRAP